MDHLLQDLCAYKLEYIFTACFGPHGFFVGYPKCHFNPYYMTSKMTLMRSHRINSLKTTALCLQSCVPAVQII